MKQAYTKCAIRGPGLELVEALNVVIDDFRAQGFTMTLRQLYYQAIGHDLFPDSWIDVAYNRKEGLPDDTKNTKKNYKRLGGLVTDARMAGLMDWDMIEDRGREPVSPSEWNSVADILDAAAKQFRLPRRATQPLHVELWVEKDALSGILEPLAREAHAILQINKGYSSSSAMYGAAQRMLADTESLPGGGILGMSLHKPVVVLYLGDHDPSGEDMVRDVRERLTTFGVGGDSCLKPSVGLVVKKIGLTLAQVRQYDLPPNPAKVTDSRAQKYVAKYGDRSWELDALTPAVLTDLVRAALSKYTAQSLVDEIKNKEAHQRRLARPFLYGVRKIVGK